MSPPSDTLNSKPGVIPLGDIQSGVFDPSTPAAEAHVFLNISDAAGARAFLGALSDQITSEAQKRPARRVNVGFTWDGLRVIGIEASVLASFPDEFRFGMAARASLLGDTGASDPRNWDAVYDGRLPIHLWLMIQIATEAEREDWLETQLRGLGSALQIVGIERASQFGDAHRPAKEHFGFNDGVGQPGVEGVGERVRDGQGTWRDGRWQPIPVGCFLLGYENGFGEVVTRPTDARLRVNGTYMVFRKLEQDVVAFRNFVDDTATELGIDPELCAAKFVGRWRSGAPLALAPEHDDPGLVDDDSKVDSFLFMTDEQSAAGWPVPHFAHIRRANPRDSLGADGARDLENGKYAPVIDPTNHRIIRRSAPYGQFLPYGATDDGQRRGILFRAYNASILDQFELVQSQWINSGNEMHGLSSDRDPLVGSSDTSGTGLDPGLGSTFTIPRADGTCPTRYNLPSFVTVRGGGYFFIPSLAALASIVAIETAPDQPIAPARQAAQHFTALYGQIGAAPGLTDADRQERQIELVLATQGEVVALGQNLRAQDATKIFETPIGFMVSTFADTQEVFANDDVFSVAGYRERIAQTTGPFMLGMDAGPTYDHENTIMRIVAPSSDLPGLSRWLDVEMRSIAAMLATGEPFDLVGQVANRLPLRFIYHYFGVPGPNDDVLMRWLRAIGLHVFEFWSPWIPGVAEAANSAALAFVPYLDQLIADRQAALAAGEPLADDVLTRLLRLAQMDAPGHPGGAHAMDRVGIRRNLAGFALGSVVAASTSIVAAIGYLLAEGNEGALAATREVARGGDDDRLVQCMLEAVRLGSPTPPILCRTATRDYVLAKGTPRETMIPSGSVVGLYPAMAMTDPDAVPQPMSFQTDRPRSIYVMFGEGMHRCFGTAIGELFLKSVGRALLSLDGLRQVTAPARGEGIPGSFYPGAYWLCANKPSKP